MVQQGFGSGRQAQAGRGRELTRERIEEVDEKIPSPKTRAEEVFAVFQLAESELDEDFSRYDVLCFAVQYIGMQSLGDLNGDEDFEILAKNLNRWLHHHHYHYAEEIFEKEDKEADR